MEIAWNEIAFGIAKDIEKEVIPLFGTKKAAEIVGENVSGDTTEYVDRVSENIALSRLNALGVNVVSEEIGFVDNGSDYTVVIDPIDGSYNFVSGIPIFAFSFAVFQGKRLSA